MCSLRCVLVLVAGVTVGCGSSTEGTLFTGNRGGSSNGGQGGRTGAASGGASASGGSASGGVSASIGGGAGETGGEAGLGGAGGDGLPPDAGPPPDDSACVEGTFTGNLSGTYTTAAIILPASVPIDLPLTGTLKKGSSPGFLDLEATGSGIVYLVQYKGRLSGRVDCKTGMLKDGQLVGGYGGGGPGSADFQGPATGFVDFATGTLSGTWDGKETNPKYGGTGSWRATLSQ